MNLVAKPILDPERSRWITGHIPYRVRILQGLDIDNLHHGPNGVLLPVFGCIFEANLLCCRWMVGFLGVRVAGSSLVPVQEHERKSDDVFSIDLGGNLLDPSSLIPADRDLLVTVYIGSNKASAHPVKEGAHQMNDLDVQPASSILVKEVRDKLYAAQSLTAPF